MFNQNTLNYNSFNYSTTASSQFAGQLKYGNYEMPNNNFRLRNVEGLEDSNTILKDIYDIANTHGQGLRNYFHKRKVIRVSGTFYADDKAGLQAAINSAKANLAVPNQTVYRLDGEGNVLTGNAYCDDWTIYRERRTVNVVRVEFTLVVLSPFLYKQTRNEEAFTSKSASFTGNVAYNGGNFEAKPQVTIAFQTGLSGVTSVAVQIGDNTITVSEAISDSQTLIIDCKDQDVLLNSVGGKDFIGIFPVLARGDNAIDVTINGTRTADIYFRRQDTYV